MESDKEREGAWRWIGKDSETERERERGSKVSIRGAWSLWTMAARFKAPQKEPSSAMTDSADKRWSMKADRCADSRREALAPAGRVHYCGQTQLSGPNGPSTFLPCHHADVTQREPGPVHPLASLPPVTEHCIPALKHSQAILLHNFILEGNISVDRCWN